MDVDGDGKISDDAYNDSKGHFEKAAEIGKKLLNNVLFLKS